MKKWIYIIIGFVVVSTVLYFSISVTTDGGCPPPDKPDNVPVEATWKGGCDGGSWVELVSIEEEKVRFRIYRDWNGDLILDSDFKYVNCKNFKLTELNWKKCAGDFINGYIGVYQDCNQDLKCRLEPIYPAYYDEGV